MGEREQLLVILACVRDAPWGWGRQTLINMLRGDGAVVGRSARALHPKARAQAQFGALAFRSATAVGGLVDCLEHAGFLQKRQIDGAGFVLEVTQAGRCALHRPGALDAMVAERAQPVRQRATRKAPATVGAEPEVDETLLETLRGWRLEQARARRVPPYMVFHDSVLRAISAQQPLALDALLTIKGVGSHKLDRYGDAIVQLVRTHLGFSVPDQDGPGDGPDAGAEVKPG
jgi:ATP-dependent DNA helicase RecQ